VKNSVEKSLTILCADDHTLVGDALVEVLATAGYMVERASDGDEAWEKLSTDLPRFDVVIADHQLGNMGGLQLAGRLRDARYPGRIIVHSADLADGDAALYRAIAVEAIIVKSDEAAKLLGIMKALHRQT
jgi:CheY-like chemotaxis protein